MFGLKLKSWMETHLVRPRKKQQPASKPRTRADSDGVHEQLRGRLLHVGESCFTPEVTVPAAPLVDKHEDSSSGRQPAVCGRSAVDSILLPSHEHGYSSGANLSSPESAYSTGYSTDGTSPGASVPPEYYINIRTGTHYIHSARAPEDGGDRKADPRRRHWSGVCRHDNTFKKFFMGNSKKSPERRGDISSRDPTSAARKHCHKEDCQPSKSVATSIVEVASRRFVKNSPKPKVINHLKNLNAGASRVPSPVRNDSLVTCSPRQRNRIRTNPWLSPNASLASARFAASHELLRSSGSIHACEEGSAARGGRGNMSQRARAGQQCAVRLDDHKSRVSPTRPSWSVSPSFTESRLGRFSSSKQPQRTAMSSSSSSESSRTPHQLSPTASSDSLDDDADLTLNEILGKFDESYVYEKETDILSDSDPTDCDEDYEYTGFDLDNYDEGERGAQGHDDFDFIDNCSVVELNIKEPDTRNSKSFDPFACLVNKGHCTYYVPPISSEDALFCESFPKPPSVLSCSADESTHNSKSFRRSSVKKNLEDELHFSSGSKEKTRYRKYKLHAFEKRKNDSICNNVPNQPSENINNIPSIQNLSSVETNCEVKQTCKEKPPSDSCESIILKTRNINLNGMLIKRLMPFYIGKGSQSAGNTPVALRKQLLTADRWNHIEKNCQDRSNLCGLKNHISNVNTTSLSKGSENKCSDFMKAKRALSLNHSPPKDKLLKSDKQPKLIENVSSEAAIMEADIEATRKYKELISEAEHILVSIKENMLTDNNRFMDLEPQLQPDEFSQENRRTDTHFKTYNTTQSARGSMKSKACVTSLSRKLTMKKLRSCDNISESQNVKLFSKRCSRKRRDVRSGTRRQCQQLSNDFSNNEIQQTSSETGSQISLDSNKPNELKNSRSLLLNSSTKCANSPRPCSKLLQFQSIDLGNCLSDSGYCPQSEPVKRKVYSGSSMLKKLQKSVRKDNTTTQGPNHLDKEKDSSQTVPDAVPWGETLSSKLMLIQHERLVVEAAVLEAQEEERQRASDSAQYHEQVAHLRRQVFLHTIEGLKRSLEDQSAKLEQAYTADASEGQPCTACDVD